MAEKIIMPKSGMSMEKGTIVKWLKEIGDKVSYGDPLLEIETDKTTMQVESMSDGYLLAKLYDADAEVPVVTTIGYIGELGEELPQEEHAATPGAKEIVEQAKPQAAPKPAIAKAGGKIPATPAARRLARELGVRLEDVPADGAIHARDIMLTGETKATPLAKRIAGMQGLDIRDVQGSGHGGKIFSADLAAASKPLPAQKSGSRAIKFTGMRRTIARRMLQSHMEIPPVTLNCEADVTGLSELRNQINNVGGIKVSFNDLVVRACAVALGEFPQINSSYTDDGILEHEDINIGIAVALDDGLIVPVIRNAGRLSLTQLSSRAKELAAKSRDGGLSPDEYTGGTFTISNMGMFGITSFTPIINLPESCILGVCAISERVAMKADGGCESRKYMGLSLTFDHRCVDGAIGAKFLQRLSALLKNPVEILI